MRLFSRRPHKQRLSHTTITMSLQIDILLMQCNNKASQFNVKKARDELTHSYCHDRSRRSNDDRMRDSGFLHILWVSAAFDMVWLWGKFWQNILKCREQIMTWCWQMITNDVSKKVIPCPFLFQILHTDFLATKPTQTTSSSYGKMDSPFWLEPETSSTTLAFRIWRKIWSR